MDVANVVTPEKAVEINNVTAKIAASTLGRTAEAEPAADPKAAGLESILDYTRTKTVWLRTSDDLIPDPFVMR